MLTDIVAAGLAIIVTVGSAGGLWWLWRHPADPPGQFRRSNVQSQPPAWLDLLEAMLHGIQYIVAVLCVIAAIIGAVFVVVKALKFMWYF